MAKTLNIGSSSSPVDIAITTGGIKDKNASLGTSGQVLTSDGSKVYWGDAASGLSEWKLLGSATNKTLINYTLGDYDEIMIVVRGRVSTTVVDRYISKVIPAQELSSTVMEVWDGGISSSSGGYGVDIKVSNSTVQLNWVYNAGSEVTSYTQYVKVYGRKNVGLEVIENGTY